MASPHRADLCYDSKGWPYINSAISKPWLKDWAPGGPRYAEGINHFVQAVDPDLFLALSPDTGDSKPLWHVCRSYMGGDAIKVVFRYCDREGNPVREIDPRLTERMMEINSEKFGPERKKALLDQMHAEVERETQASLDAHRREQHSQLVSAYDNRHKTGPALFSEVTADLTNE